MRTVAIVGAGQAGLLLGMGLIERGFRVTLIADRTPEEILHGPVPAGAMVFDSALQVERDLKINFWDGTATPATSLRMDVVEPGKHVAMSIESELERPALCIDQRLKSARWMKELERRGGRLIVKPADIADLEAYAKSHDLVVVAAGKGPIAQLFPKDEARSPFDAPARHISMVVVRGARPWENFKVPGVKFLLLPGIGEMFSAPMYTKDEIQGIFLGFEAIPGGPMDRFIPGMSPEAMLELSKELFRDLVPWDYESIRDATLVDGRAHLHGRILPIVRKPVGRLPSGAIVMGLADTVNLQDPIAAQGANNAHKAARVAMRRIAERGDEAFDAEWMTDVFEEIWADARYTNTLAQKLLAPPEPHVLEILGAASQSPKVAWRFINGFNHPPDLFPWFVDPAEAQRFLATTMAA